MKTSTTLSQAIEEYLRGRRARFSKTTVTNETHVLLRFARWYGNVQVRNMRAERVEEWFIELRQPHSTALREEVPPVSPGTYNFYRTRLASLFRWCTRRGLLKTDLLAEVTPLTVPKKTRLRPAPAVLLDLPNHAENARDRAFIAMLCGTAFRRSTALALRVRDLDLGEGWLQAKITKTAEEDVFPISSDLEPELRCWLRAYAVDIGRPLTGDEVLFPRRVGVCLRWVEGEDGRKVRTHERGRWDPTTAMRSPELIVQRALRRAGVEVGPGEGCHTLRRAVARAVFDSLSSQGHDHAVKQVSAMLHHRNLQTTESYLGLNAEVERRNLLMRGKPLLSAMVRSEDAEVVNLRRQP